LTKLCLLPELSICLLGGWPYNAPHLCAPQQTRIAESLSAYEQKRLAWNGTTMKKGTVGVCAILCLAVTLMGTRTLWALDIVPSTASIRAAEPATIGQLSSLQDVQKYNRSIHIMAMLLVGFGFLMVFVKKYGRSAVTATYLLVSVAIPVYFLVNGLGVFGKPEAVEIDKLILAEFGAASLLICAGAVLGRLKMGQYLVLGVLFIVCYMLNEWVVLKGGLGLIAAGFADTGGSIVIHAFGALFGLGVILTMTTPGEFSEKIECDGTSDRFSMLGSMVLWIFWPSFCAALVAPEMIPSRPIWPPSPCATARSVSRISPMPRWRAVWPLARRATTRITRWRLSLAYWPGRSRRSGLRSCRASCRTSSRASIRAAF